MTPLDMTKPGDIWLSYTFHYRPDTVGNVTQIVLFSILTIIMFVENIVFARRTGNPARYMHLITATGVMEAVGYGLRIQAAESSSLVSFIVTSLLLLVAPIFLAAVNYVVIGKLLKASGKKVGCIKPNQATCIFLTADIVCFLFQCSSAGLLASSDPAMQNAGTGAVLIGLAVQLLFFTYFFGIALHMAFSKQFAMMANPSLRPVLIGSFASVSLLFVRNVYRFVEYASGHDSDLSKSELVFFLFETAPIFFAFVTYCLYHFGYLLPVDAELPALVAKGPGPKEADSNMKSVEMQQV